jgi:protein-export membrane protein SecD/preprotein translocase SecF subunit
MKRYANSLTLFFVAILTGFSIWVVWPDMPERYLPDFIPWPSGTGMDIGDFDRESMRLGLDLKGGTRVLLEADERGRAGTSLDDALDGAVTIIDRRVNAYGVSEAEVQRQGANRISVQLPGVAPEEASDLIGKTAELEFRQPRLDEFRNIVCQTPDGGTTSIPAQTGRLRVDEAGSATCLDASGLTIGQVIWDTATQNADGTGPQLTGRFLSSAETGFDQLGQPLISIKFNSDGGDIFEQITGRLVGYPLGIFVDDTLVSAPTVQTRIAGGQGQITGLTLQEAKTLSAQLNAGALPVPLIPIQVQEVDATLGDDAVRKSIQAGEIGILVVMLFMIVNYRLPGVLASVALVTYTATILMIFKLWPVTLSLAGIAAFVLSVGMAVDANILVFERMKEELRAGRSLVGAIEAGFSRAWSSIRDSNVATLITCGILFWFGDQFNANPVKGFAVTLAIGVLISMFSAVFVTLSLLRAWVGTPMMRHFWAFGVDREERPAGTSVGARRFRPAFDFVGKRGFFYLVSIAVMVPGFISLAIPPALKPGIEFTSGSTFSIRFQQDVSQEDLRTELATLGHPEARVQRASDGSYIVRTDALSGSELAPPLGPAPPSEREALEEALVARFGPMVDNSDNVVNRFLNLESISASVSRDIGRNATIAVIVASSAILLYITWAFRHLPNPFVYGTAAIIALLHDVGVTIGLFSIFGKAFDAEVNTMFITALLTVIGFSVHDTIVVFDRVRENRGRYPDMGLGEIVNASLTETLNRSLATSLTVIFTIVAMLLLGGSTIRDFLLVLLVGIISGTYSSIFVASQLLVTWDSGFFAQLRKRLPKPRPEAEPAARPQAGVVR